MQRLPPEPTAATIHPEGGFSLISTRLLPFAWLLALAHLVALVWIYDLLPLELPGDLSPQGEVVSTVPRTPFTAGFFLLLQCASLVPFTVLIALRERLLRHAHVNRRRVHVERMTPEDRASFSLGFTEILSGAALLDSAVFTTLAAALGAFILGHPWIGWAIGGASLALLGIAGIITGALRTQRIIKTPRYLEA